MGFGGLNMRHSQLGILGVGFGSLTAGPTQVRPNISTAISGMRLVKVVTKSIDLDPLSLKPENGSSG